MAASTTVVRAGQHDWQDRTDDRGVPRRQRQCGACGLWETDVTRVRDCAATVEAVVHIKQTRGAA